MANGDQELETNRADETILLAREAIEALTAIGNYLAAANCLVDGDRALDRARLASVFERAFGQLKRAGKATRALRDLIDRDASGGEGGR